MIRYGIKDCKHIFVNRISGYEETCGPVICQECGAFGCACDARGEEAELYLRTLLGFTAEANPNGKWVNPYVKIIPKLSEG